MREEQLAQQAEEARAGAREAAELASRFDEVRRPASYLDSRAASPL